MTFRPGSFMWPTLLGLTVLQGGSDTTRSETARPWRLVNGHHWQVVRRSLLKTCRTRTRARGRGARVPRGWSMSRGA
jgi:hypothetical protein